MVTRSLVSYDLPPRLKLVFHLLNGHQIIGELRLNSVRPQNLGLKLNGHQIIGELRLHQAILLELKRLLNGHQIIGELRLNKILRNKICFIEWSPDHW